VLVGGLFQGEAYLDYLWNTYMGFMKQGLLDERMGMGNDCCHTNKPLPVPSTLLRPAYISQDYPNDTTASPILIGDADVRENIETTS